MLPELNVDRSADYISHIIPEQLQNTASHFEYVCMSIPLFCLLLSFCCFSLFAHLLRLAGSDVGSQALAR